MHDRISVHSACFRDEPLRALTGYWQELGARRVSLYSGQIFDEGLDAVQTALAAGNSVVETICHPLFPGHVETNRDAWIEARQRFSRVIQAAKTLGARSIYTVSGGHGDLIWEDAAECFAAAIAPCVAEAEAAGILLTIECVPQAYPHNSLAHTLRDTVILAELAGIGVCIDIFAAWMEAGLRATIERAMPNCHLIQIGDYFYGDRSFPARAVVGDGVIPIKRICGWALDAGYKGVFDLEILGPRIDQEGRVAAVARSVKNLGEILQSLGA